MERPLTVEEIEILVRLQHMPTAEAFASSRREPPFFVAVDASRLKSWQEQQDQILLAINERDSIQASRPEGCWCLGVGGNSAIWYPAVAPPLYRCGLYCDCADGQRVEAAVEEYELQRRRRRDAEWAEQLIVKANIPVRFAAFTFDTYPVSSATQRALDRIRAWASDNQAKASLFLTGPTGSGKTGCAVASTKVIVRDTLQDATFWTVGGLLAAIKRSFDSKGKPDVLEEAKWAGVLVLDDLGTENPTAWAYETLFELINHRHGENLITIVTSNHSLAELSSRIGKRLKRETGEDAQLAGDRLAYRLAEMCEVVRLAGPNLRDPGQVEAIKSSRAAVQEAESVLKGGRK